MSGKVLENAGNQGAAYTFCSAPWCTGVSLGAGERHSTMHGSAGPKFFLCPVHISIIKVYHPSLLHVQKILLPFTIFDI